MAMGHSSILLLSLGLTLGLPVPDRPGGQSREAHPDSVAALVRRLSPDPRMGRETGPVQWREENPSKPAASTVPAREGGDADCIQAARTLGAMGLGAITAVEPLSRAARTGCGSGDPTPGRSLSLIAGALLRAGPSLSAEDLEAGLAVFESAEQELGMLPEGVSQSLAGVRSLYRTRRFGWVAPAVGLAGSGLAAGASALRFLSGILAALLLTVLLLLLLRNFGRVLPGFGKRLQGAGADRSRSLSLEIWLRRPEKRGSNPLGLPAGKPGTKGREVDVILAEIRTRQEAARKPPPRDRVEELLGALAWEATLRGNPTGPVPEEALPDWVRQAEGPGTADFICEDLSMARRGPGGQGLSLTLEREEILRLGARHVLKEERPSPSRILAEMGEIHGALANRKNRTKAASLLREVAHSLLEAADHLEEGAPGLGIAEAALLELAGLGQNPELGRVGDRGEGAAPNRRVKDTDPQAQEKTRRLLRRLEGESNPAVREKIFGAMGRLGPGAGAALPTLVEAVERETPGAALAAMESLGRMGPAAAPAAPLLVGALESGRPSHRLTAARALGRLGTSGEAAAPVLLEWISRDGVPHQLMAGAAEALGGMPGQAEAAIPPLTQLLRSPVAREVQAAAALALGRLDPGRREVLETLKEAGKRGDPTVRGMVEIAIIVRNGRVGTKRGATGPVPPLRWLLPMTFTAAVLGGMEFLAVLGTELLSPGTVLPALFLAPVLAFVAGMIYAFVIRKLPLHPALGSGAAGGGGVSAGLLLGFLASSAMTPVGVMVGGGLAAGSGVFAGTLIHTALEELQSF